MRLIAQNLPSDQAIQSIQLVGIPFAVGLGDDHAKIKDGYIVTPPGFRMIIIARPQARAFIPKGLMIENDGQWLIHDIRIGNKSMVITGGGEAIPAAAMRGQMLTLDKVVPGQDFAIEASYIGPSSDPQPFVCDVIGDAE